jgi:hypothetical protein
MLSLDSQETALRHLLIFRYRWASTKIAAGVVLKFLGKQEYPEKCPFATASTNKFSLRNATENFWMSRWNSHSGLLPDYCIYPVIMRMPDFSMVSKNIAPTFLGNFSSQVQNFRWQKILVALTTKIRFISGIVKSMLTNYCALITVVCTLIPLKSTIYFCCKFVCGSYQKNSIMVVCKFLCLP